MATVLGASAPPEGALRRVAPPQHPLSEPEAGGARQVRLDRSRQSRLFRGWRCQVGLLSDPAAPSLWRRQAKVRGGCTSDGICAPLVNPACILSGQGFLSGMPAVQLWKLSLRATTSTSELIPAGDPPWRAQPGPQTEVRRPAAAAPHLHVPSHWCTWTCVRSLYGGSEIALVNCSHLTSCDGLGKAG